MALDKKAYTTVGEVQDDLGLDRDEETPYLEGLIAAASRQIDKFCGRQFWYDTYTEVHQPDARLVLKQTPAHAITSITDTETALTLDTTEYTLEEPDYGLVWLDVDQPVYYKQAGRVIPGHAYAVKRTLEVVYTAGYRTPAQAVVVGVDDLPDDLQLVCRMMVADFYSNRGSNPRVKRRHLLEAAVWYDQQFRDDQFTSLLQPYRRFVQ